MLGGLVHAAEGSGTPLKGAVALGEPAIVTKLIEQGADVGATDQSGFTALAYAAQLDEPDVAIVLINAGARPWTPDPTTSPLMIAAVSGSSRVIAPLLSKGVPAVVYNDALAAAAGRGDPFTVNQIVQAAALSADDMQHLTAALNARLGSKTGLQDAMSPIAALAALNTCREVGLYSTDRCISAKLVEHLRAVATPIPPQDCDELTTFLFDPDRLPDLKPVYFENLDAPKAIAACEIAIKRFPNEARFYAAIGRAYTKLGRSDATYYLRRSIEMNSRFGLYELAANYQTGVGVEKNYEKAGEYFSQAANLGVYEAVSALGGMYQYGRGVTQNYAKAMPLYQTAASQGDAQAMVNIGDMLAQGLGTEKKPYAAFQSYTKAAETGFIVGRERLAWAYQNGIGVDKDLHKFFVLVQELSRDGDSHAMVDLAIIYRDGNGVDKDKVKARELFHKSMISGSYNGMGQLGLMLVQGEGGPRELSRGRDLIEKSANQGDTIAMQNLAAMYSTGTGVPKDFKQAVIWIKKSAAGGNAEAIKWLATNAAILRRQHL